MNIQEASLQDLDFLQQLEKTCFSTHRQSTRKSLRHSILSAHQKVLIAHEGDTPCGSMILLYYKNQIRIYSLAVLPEFNGRGIGSALVNYAIHTAKTFGVGTLSLEADILNSSLVKWYENFGFQAMHVIMDYYAKDEDAVRMTLEIESTKNSRNIVVTDFDTDFFQGIPGITQIRANTYIEDPLYQSAKNVRIFNLCSSFSYQTVGYYVSLLAQARNHSVYPNIISLRDFKSNTILKSICDEIFDRLQRDLESEPEQLINIDIYFGYCSQPKYQPLAKALNLLYEAPLIRYQFEKKPDWTLKKVTTLALESLPDLAAIKPYAIKYFQRKRFVSGAMNRYKYDMAILVDAQEPNPPSCPDALARFKAAAESLGFYVEMISKKDYKRIPEFDALFIRTTTNVNNYTYDFSRYAYAEGLVVIDDPWSILRCSNKLYLFEAMKAGGLKMPKTWTFNKKALHAERIQTLTYPIILKQPDSAFSLGVHKVSNADECAAKLGELFKTSEIIIAQEFLPTEYDWRIGILDKNALFACKYYMAKDHWQIYNWANSSETEKAGAFETLPIASVPPKVLKAALKAANLIGDGLYGVDIKEIDGEPYIIEVNDNPSIDYTVEDAFLKDALYLAVMRTFYNRLANDREIIRPIT